MPGKGGGGSVGALKRAWVGIDRQGQNPDGKGSNGKRRKQGGQLVEGNCAHDIVVDRCNRGARGAAFMLRACRPIMMLKNACNDLVFFL